MKRLSGLKQGFTLVEILVTITIIAILAGMLVVGVLPLLRTSQEMTIRAELTQLERGIEHFKTKYGAYPPSFVAINNADQMLAYLNRLVPNNAEGSLVGPSGPRFIDLWWDGVGRYIQHQHGEDLVFWLSALCKNRAHPLTNGITNAAQMPAAFASDADVIEREIFFEFRNKQLIPQSDRLGPVENNHKVACYNQDSQELAPYRYIDSANYANFLVLGNRQFTGYWYWANPPGGNPMTAALPTQLQIQNRDVIFENAKTFQLAAPGSSRMMGGEDYIMGGNILLYSVADADTLTNFSEGRLGIYADERSGK